MPRSLAEDIARSRQAIALARDRGMDTAAWEDNLSVLERLYQTAQDRVLEAPTTSAPVTSSHQKLLSRVTEWAGDDPKHWQRLHGGLLRIYTPEWEYIDARDILVAWAAAYLALNRAKRELIRLEGLHDHLTRHEIDTKRARKADVTFWGRLVHRLGPQAPVALAQDTKAQKVLVSPL